jgi:hypothetical protein
MTERIESLAADIAVMNTQVVALRIRADACRREAEDLIRQLEEKHVALEDCICNIVRGAIEATGQPLGDENV